MIFRECEYCLASLDPGERCDCREVAEREKKKADAERRASVTGVLMAAVGQRKRP